MKSKTILPPDPKFHPWSDCSTCKYFDFINTTCNAYPDKIPSEIYGNWVKHRCVRSDQIGEWVYETAQWAIDAGIKTDRPTRN